MTLPVRIANFELGPKDIVPVYQGKFIVVNAPESIDVYAGPSKSHLVLSLENGISYDEVMGGGRYTFAYDGLTLFDTSTAFGSVHSGVREEIARGLVTHLTSEGFKVTSTDISKLTDVKKTDRNFSKWEYAGFPVTG